MVTSRRTLSSRPSSSTNQKRRPPLLITLLCFLTVLGFFHIRSDFLSSSIIYCPSSKELPSAISSSALGDGCYHVFLDVGANMGVHGRFLLEPEKYPDANISRTIFDKYFGSPKSRNNRDICVFAFEPNPKHHEKLANNSQAYARMGWRYHVIPAGVGIEDGTLDFYSNKEDHQDDFMFQEQPPEHFTTHIEVPVIHFAPWILQHIVNRKIPTPSFSSTSSHNSTSASSGGQPKVVMKMDIERMEFIVLPDLILHGGALCHIDFAFIEMHGTSHEHNIFDLNMWGFIGSKQFINTKGRCPTEMSRVDDESYRLDGIPLPEPS